MTTPYLHIVRTEPPKASPPLEVRISVSDQRRPQGQSRVFRIKQDDVNRLLDAAARLEAAP
jgi:hypothetical protein